MLPMNEDERGDAFRGIPKLRLLVVLEYYLGVPWASQSLGPCHSLFHSPSNLTQNLKTSITQNFKTLVISVSIIKQHHFKYCCKLIHILFLHFIYCIITSPWLIPPIKSTVSSKLAKQCIKNRICLKHDSL